MLFGGKLPYPGVRRDVPVRDRGLTDENESYLLGLEPRGQALWQVVRPSAVADRTRPSPRADALSYNGTRQLLVLGGDVIYRS